MNETTWDWIFKIVTFILSVVGSFLGICNYFHNRKHSQKEDKRAEPNFDIRFKSYFIDEEHADINRDYDSLDISVVTASGIASNVMCDVLTLVQLDIMGNAFNIPLHYHYKCIDFFDWSTTYIDDRNCYIKKGVGSLAKLRAFTEKLNKFINEKFPDNVLCAIVSAHHYITVSYVNGLKENHKAYYHNNHLISEQIYNYAKEETEEYIDLNRPKSWDKIIDDIANHLDNIPVEN